MRKLQAILQNDIDEIFKKYNLAVCSFIITPCVGEIKVYCFSSFNIHNVDAYELNERRFEGWMNVPCKYSSKYIVSKNSNDIRSSLDDNSSSVFYCKECNFSLSSATSFLIEALYFGKLYDKDEKNMEKDINEAIKKHTQKSLYKLILKESRC